MTKNSSEEIGLSSQHQRHCEYGVLSRDSSFSTFHISGSNFLLKPLTSGTLSLRTCSPALDFSSRFQLLIPAFCFTLPDTDEGNKDSNLPVLSTRVVPTAQDRGMVIDRACATICLWERLFRKTFPLPLTNIVLEKWHTPRQLIQSQTYLGVQMLGADVSFICRFPVLHIK